MIEIKADCDIGKTELMTAIDTNTDYFAPDDGEGELLAMISDAKYGYDTTLSTFMIFSICSIFFCWGSGCHGILYSDDWKGTSLVVIPMVPTVLTLLIGSLITLGRLEDFHSEVKVAKNIIDTDFVKINPCLGKYTRVNTENFNATFTDLSSMTRITMERFSQLLIYASSLPILLSCCAIVVVYLVKTGTDSDRSAAYSDTH